MRMQTTASIVGTAVLLVVGGAVLAQGPTTGGQPGQPNQPGQPGQGRRQGRAQTLDLTTVPVQVLDGLVTLTADQKTKITAITEKFAADQKALRPAPGTPVDPATRQKMTDLRRQATADIAAVLTTEQKAKLREMAPYVTTLRTAGVPLQVLVDLKLTKEQIGQLRDIARDVQQKTRAIPRTATPEERRTQRTQIRADALAKVQGVLTADQKAVIKKYEDAHPRRGGRRGGA